MEAYNTEKYLNEVIDQRARDYITSLENYLTSICPSFSNYFIRLNVNIEDFNKILYHNKFSNTNPKDNIMDWNKNIFKGIQDAFETQQNAYIKLDYLTKFNAITNIISNIYTPTSPFRINTMKNLLDASVPYKYDYSYYSIDQRSWWCYY